MLDEIEPMEFFEILHLENLLKSYVHLGSQCDKPTPRITYAYRLKFFKQVDFIDAMELTLNYGLLISRSSGLCLVMGVAGSYFLF